MHWHHVVAAIAAMLLLIGVIAAAALKPYWPLWAPHVEPIVIPPNAMLLGGAWPRPDMCAWYPPPLDQPVPCALWQATEQE
jgi:hypothetical protein